MPNKFYQTKKWKCARAAVLRRDKYICQGCNKYGRRDKNGQPVKADTVHHIKERDTHPELALCKKNLISLCRRCHNKLHPEKGKHSFRNKKSHPPST